MIELVFSVGRASPGRSLSNFLLFPCSFALRIHLLAKCFNVLGNAGHAQVSRKINFSRVKNEIENRYSIEVQKL